MRKLKGKLIDLLKAGDVDGYGDGDGYGSLSGYGYGKEKDNGLEEIYDKNP